MAGRGEGGGSEVLLRSGFKARSPLRCFVPCRYRVNFAPSTFLTGGPIPSFLFFFPSCTVVQPWLFRLVHIGSRFPDELMEPIPRRDSRCLSRWPRLRLLIALGASVARCAYLFPSLVSGSLTVRYFLLGYACFQGQANLDVYGRDFASSRAL